MTEQNLAWGIVALVIGAFAFVARPNQVIRKPTVRSLVTALTGLAEADGSPLKEQRIAAPIAVPHRGETWVNRWGFSFHFESFNSDGHYVLSVSDGYNTTSRVISPELWPQLVQEMSLVNRRN